MKILQIHGYPPTEGGGLEINVYLASKEMATRGHDVTIATDVYSKKQKKTKKYAKEGISIILIRRFSDLAKIIDKADIVNIHFTFSCRQISIDALEYCVTNNKKCVFTMHTHYKSHVAFADISKISDKERTELLKKVGRLLDAENIIITGPSPALHDNLSYLKCSSPGIVIPNGIPAIKNSKKDPKISEVDLTYIGELSKKKGVGYLIDALYLARKKLPDIKVRLIGKISDKSITEMISYFDLEENIELTGYIEHDKALKYLAATKLYVQPSLTEMWSTSILEALINKVPCICTAVAGTPYLLQNGKFGNLVEGGNAGDMAKSIVKYLSRNSSYRALCKKAEKARKFIVKNYTMKYHVDNLLELYSLNTVQTKSNRISPALTLRENYRNDKASDRDFG